MLVPLLSEADPAAASEGSIDPLGLFATGDVLAERLVPGVRERQRHPRFLTATAVSLAVCQDFDPDRLAADGVSEPWQVFEWYAVEGLVRTEGDDERVRGVPGVEKARRAIRDRVPLSAARYLKNPGVFGFHGVYRPLARSLGIEEGGGLGQTGVLLLEAWMGDRRLKGFWGAADGPGRKQHSIIAEAVEDGLTKGAVARGPGWGGWKFFGQHLRPGKTSKAEGKVLREALLDLSGGHRREVLEFLASEEGKAAWAAEEMRGQRERRFHEALLPHASQPLAELLDTILAYERFGRLIQDAFDDCLYAMTRQRGKTPVATMADCPCVRTATEQVPDLYAELAARLQTFGESVRFQETFANLADKLTPTEWVQRVLDHHCRIQRGKPPDGKLPWFDRFDDGGCIVRAGYRRENGVSASQDYARPYRTEPLWDFALDLGMVR